MTRMQRPAVVFFYKTPLLSRKFPLNRIFFNIAYCPSDCVWIVEENFPARPTPNRMFKRPFARIAKPQAAGVLEILDHIFCLMFVLANQYVYVVGHNNASIASVSVLRNRFGESIGD